MAEFIVTCTFAVPTIVILVICNRKRNELIDVGIRWAESIDKLDCTCKEVEKELANLRLRK